MFVNLGGDESSKPTYFEVVAADRLVPSLKAAVIYALSVFSQRHPWVHRLLNYDDEVFALLTLALDGQSLFSTDSTFSDSLYGLKRKPLRSGAERLSRKQRWLILACQVVLPYLRAKTEKAYRHLAATSPGSGVLGLALRYSAVQGGAVEEAGDGGASGGGSSGGEAGSWSGRLQRAFVAAYPWIHAGIEGTTFAYHLAYLLGASPAHQPVLHALGVTMARTSAKDLMDAEKAKQARRQALLTSLLGAAAAASAAPPQPPAAGLGAGAALAGGSGFSSSSSSPAGRRAAALVAAARGGLVRGVLGARWLVEDHARSALILAVFGFKALEWWYTAAEDTLAKGKALPLPPPPPPPRPLPPPLGVGLPSDPSDCPICRRRTTNPAALATSGYVFCYPCVFAHVMQHGRCPVSGLAAGLDHVRKLYEASA